MEHESMCRICGNLEVEKVSFLKFSVVADIYYKLTALQPDDTEFPDTACQQCYNTLVQIDKFRSMCLEVFDRLKKTISSSFGPKLLIKEEEKVEVEFFEMGLSVGSNFEPDMLGKGEECCNQETLEKDENQYENEADENPGKSESLNAKNGRASNTKKRKRRKIECEQCDKFFYEQKRYEGHMRIHAGLKSAVCEICQKTFSKWPYLKEHQQMVHEPAKERLTCEVPGCGRTFALKHHLKLHQVKKHTVPLQPKSRHMCEQCGKTFTTIANLKIHKYSHGGKLPFSCNLCGKRMESNFKLKIHLMRHKGIKQHTCPECGLKKTTITELKTHMNYHTRDKQYPCETCGAVFYSIGNKLRHVRIVHQGIKAYSCTYCDLSFGKAETLKHHVMTHTGEKPHACDLCGKRFIQPTALQTHKKTHLKKLN
ncbi:gastrula zinc finger protein XlCGF46.1-like [Topomyia yanbarensis]|uniref:gastrula zinc finger protein XlCGF46.1-like n=1 Tax=Topomyia yanbarensis TaxID=2498891 RepID=UPI00273C6202|nr:gastrula zinc finger protein XlCGF46.1-like [Topomyia yanbarensis]